MPLCSLSITAFYKGVYKEGSGVGRNAYLSHLDDHMSQGALMVSRKKLGDFRCQTEGLSTEMRQEECI